MIGALAVAVMVTFSNFLTIIFMISILAKENQAKPSVISEVFRNPFIVSIAIGALTSFFGAYISFFLNGATGGVIVVLQTLIFLAAFVFAPKHGILAAKRKSARALERI